jgi:hypothetical protein
VICPYVNVGKSALDESYRLAERNQMRRRATDGATTTAAHMPCAPSGSRGQQCLHRRVVVNRGRLRSLPSAGDEQANLNLAAE